MSLNIQCSIINCSVKETYMPLWANCLAIIGRYVITWCTSYRIGCHSFQVKCTVEPVTVCWYCIKSTPVVPVWKWMITTCTKDRILIKLLLATPFNWHIFYWAWDYLSLVGFNSSLLKGTPGHVIRMCANMFVKIYTPRYIQKDKFTWNPLANWYFFIKMFLANIPSDKASKFPVTWVALYLQLCIHAFEQRILNIRRLIKDRPVLTRIF